MMIAVYKMPFIFSMMFIFVGIILKIAPPKFINPIYGYRTPNSMKSKEHWDLAQILASKRSIQSGVLLLLFSLSRIAFNQIATKIQVITVISIVILFFLLVELELKNKFK